jgi:hypothetical protein
MIGTFKEHSSSTRAKRRRARQEWRLRELLTQRFLQEVARTLPDDEMSRLVDGIAARQLDPYSAAADIMNRLLTPARPNAR